MSNERLEEIRRYLKQFYNAVDVDDDIKTYVFDTLKIEWLIERVKELEIELLYYKMATESYVDMEEQNKHYREALEEIRKEGQFKNLQTGRESYNFQAKLADKALEDEHERD